MRWPFRRGDDVKTLEQALLDVARDIWQVETLTASQQYPRFELGEAIAPALTEQRTRDSLALLQRR